jgi:hypothetical protein
VHEFDGVEALEAAATVDRGVVSIREGGSFIDLLFDPAGSDTTVVTFHAALSKEMVLPLFAGGQVFQDGPTNRILVSDSGLYADATLNLAWFAGTAELRLQALLPRVLRRLVEVAGGSRLLFFGPSGGGFAALYYSRLFPGSLAVPVNPQTILMNFYEAHRRIYAKGAFGAETQVEVDGVFRDAICSDLLEHYAGQVPNHILYVQNETDEFHIDGHMRPFLDSLPEGSVRVLTGNWGDGHVATPPDQLRALARNITSRPGSWGEVIAEANTDWFTVPETWQ